MASEIGRVCRAFRKTPGRVLDGHIMYRGIGSTTILDRCGNSIRLALRRGIAIANPLAACIGIPGVRSREVRPERIVLI